MGLFFTIVTIGLAASLPTHLYHGLVSAGVGSSPAREVANEPPIGSLFSAFLGFNPVQQLLGPTGALQHMPAHQVAYITGRAFFPRLIEQSFADGLHLAFTFGAAAMILGAVASLLRGPRYVHAPKPFLEELAEGAAMSSPVPDLEPAAPHPSGSDAMMSAHMSTNSQGEIDARLGHG